MNDLIIVTASYNSKSELWSAASPDLGGAFLQATSWQALVDSVPAAVGRLLPRGLFRGSRDIAIEVIAHTSTLYPRRSSDGPPASPSQDSAGCLPPAGLAFRSTGRVDPVGKTGCRNESASTKG